MLIVKVPAINGLGKTKGCELAPNRVLEQLQDIYTNEQSKEIDFEKQEIREILADLQNIGETNKNIFEESKKILSDNKADFTLFLGGDHSISYPLFKSFSSCFENPGLLVLDAHADCMHNFEPATHEDWLRVLIEQGMKPENIILIGIRNLHMIEARFLKNKKINCFAMKELAANMQEACDAIMESAIKFSSLYLSIDIDAVDPAFAPATGYIEPAGLTSRELIYLLQRIRLLKNLKAADLVEINPVKDINNITAKLGAKIIAELQD